jgi:uncharacterized DUF497 family protein
VFEWDEDKRHENLRKHRIDFWDAATIWTGPVLEIQDRRFDYPEDRFIAYGILEGQVLAVIFTWRGGSRRIISARKTKHAERRAYYQSIVERPEVERPGE